MDKTQGNGKQFDDPVFTPSDDFSATTYEFSDLGYLYFVGIPRDAPPIYERYSLAEMIIGSRLIEQEQAYFTADLVAAN